MSLVGTRATVDFPQLKLWVSFETVVKTTITRVPTSDRTTKSLELMTLHEQYKNSYSFGSTFENSKGEITSPTVAL